MHPSKRGRKGGREGKGDQLSYPDRDHKAEIVSERFSEGRLKEKKALRGTFKTLSLPQLVVFLHAILIFESRRSLNFVPKEMWSKILLHYITTHYYPVER